MSSLKKFQSTHAWFKTVIPSTKEEIHFRAMVMKENMEISLALNENNESGYETIFTILENCIKENINIRSLPMYDIEWIILQTQRKSQGEVKKLNFDCEKCEKENIVNFDLSMLKVLNQEEAEQKRKILVGEYSDKPFYIEMNYPSIKLKQTIEAIEHAEKTNDEQLQMAAIIEICAMSIKQVYNEEDVTEFSEETIQSWKEFVLDLDSEVLAKMTEFFNINPKCVVDCSHICPHCGHQNEKQIEDLNNFF